MELQRISLNNNKQSFGAVRFPSWADMSPAKEVGIKVRKGLTWNHRNVFYAFPKKAGEAQFAQKSNGKIVSDDLAKAHIRHRRLDAISDFFERTFHRKEYEQEKWNEIIEFVRDFHKIFVASRESDKAYEAAGGWRQFCPGIEDKYPSK